MNCIEQALRDYPETRDSDRKLMIKVWELQLGKPFGEKFRQWFETKAIAAETVTRTRRKFQEQSRYRATKPVENQRYEKFKNTKESIAEAEPNEVQRLF